MGHGRRNKWLDFDGDPNMYVCVCACAYVHMYVVGFIRQVAPLVSVKVCAFRRLLVFLATIKKTTAVH